LQKAIFHSKSVTLKQAEGPAFAVAVAVALPNPTHKPVILSEAEGPAFSVAAAVAVALPNPSKKLSS
jgi:hypothetical protein